MENSKWIRRVTSGLLMLSTVFATNNRVIARVHKASDRSTATEYKYISQGVDFTLWRLAGKTYSSGVNYYLKMKTEDAANNSVDISGYWRP